MTNRLYACLRVMVGHDEWSYFCLLTSAQVRALIRSRAVKRAPARTGMALVDGKRSEADWRPVTLNRPAWFMGKAKELETLDNTLSVLDLTAARILDVEIPEDWKPGVDCIIEFRSASIRAARKPEKGRRRPSTRKPEGGAQKGQ